MRKIKHVRKLTASPQIKSDSRPPRILDQIIEMMFPFAELGRFDFDARLFSVQSIDDTKHESSDDSEPDAASANAAVALHPMTKPPIVIWFGVIRVLQRSEMIAVSIGA